jgi:FkbM family methyltransferase
MKWRRHHRYVNGYWLGQYELSLQQALCGELTAGSVFFDVGANAGFFTLLGAKRVGPKGMCVAFDPDVANIASVRAICDLNKLSWVVPVNCAVSDSTGKQWFSQPAPGAPIGHLTATDSGEGCILVPTTTLDAAAAEYGQPDVVKIDVEGAEGMVIRGAPRLLYEHRPVWLMEVHDAIVEQEIRMAFDRARYRLLPVSKDVPSASPFPKHILAHPEAS